MNLSPKVRAEAAAAKERTWAYNRAIIDVLLILKQNPEANDELIRKAEKLLR